VPIDGVTSSIGRFKREPMTNHALPPCRESDFAFRIKHTICVNNLVIGWGTRVVASAPFQVGSIPIPRTRLIGRSAERALARGFLLDEAIPLLTLTGPGGVGKTRLVMAVVDDVRGAFADGVVWVDLSPLDDTVLVPAALAAALGVRPQASDSLDDKLCQFLHARQTLLVLDNCEHMLPAAAKLVALLLSRCPALQILTTSRTRLHLQGEQLFIVDPLPLPGDAAGLHGVAHNEAVQLFTERTRAVRPAFTLTEANAPIVAALCRQLDGLPLAIELAAARGTILSPEALLAQMTDRLQVLTHGARNLPARQQTIAATIGWSYDLLDAEAQRLFQRIAVFAGGFTLDAAQAVSAPTESLHDVMTTLESLVAHSLVRRADGQDEARFEMLETVRAFALARLAEAGKEQRIRARHAAFFADLAEQADMEVRGPRGTAWIERCQMELPNIRVALGWAGSADGDPVLGLRLASALSLFWVVWNRVEGHEWLERLLIRGADVPMEVRADALLALGFLLALEPVGTRADEVLEQSKTLFARLNDALGLTHVANYQGILAERQRKPDRADPLLKEAIANYAARGMTAWEGITITWLANVAIQRNDLDHARDLFEASLQLLERAGWEAGKASALGSLGWIATLRGEFDHAETMVRESLALAWKSHNLLTVFEGIVELASIAAQRGVGRRAARWGGAAQRLGEKIGYPLQTSDHPDLVATTRHLLAEAFLMAWDSGRALPIEQVVAEATDPHGRLPDEPGAVPPARRSKLRRNEQIVLTRREREVLALLCQHLTNPEIAERLFVGTRTIDSHVANILAKFGVAHRRDAIAAAVRFGLA
jgi:non-specific serine/threonine protein kinase